MVEAVKDLFLLGAVHHGVVDRRHQEHKECADAEDRDRDGIQNGISASCRKIGMDSCIRQDEKHKERHDTMCRRVSDLFAESLFGLNFLRGFLIRPGQVGKTFLERIRGGFGALCLLM